MRLPLWQAGAQPFDPALRDLSMNGPPRRAIHKPLQSMLGDAGENA
jgi:hypothetical protein